MKLLVVIVFILFFSCKNNPFESKAERQARETDEFIDSMEMDRKVDSMVKETMASVYRNVADSAGSWRSPVIVKKARFVEREYSNYKDVRLTYKNVSGKRIDAIKFKWYGLDAFGEAADAGGINGLGGGFDDDPLSPGQTRTSTWPVLSRDGKKITSAFAYEIVFSDGTKWDFEQQKLYGN
jgi:hypothetical protein